jgi:acetyl-CoA carboxylase, biotin carboxylase subunit
MLKKVLIANRGEIALRILRACRESGIPSVAVYSNVDAEALHVQQADQAVCIGPAPASKSYLNITAILDAARETGADAIHPGYGFLAENAGFAAACREQGVKFIGPSPETIEQMGDKVTARRLAMEAGVPVVPGTEGTIAADKALSAAQEIGYPLMVKAAAGGGGRGIRVASTPEELREAVQVAEQESTAAFGDGSLYLEKRLVNARHVEVQVLGDQHGQLVHLYVRECSMQRRRQKVLEEAPSLAISSSTQEAMTAAALRLAQSVGYTNAGTLEFLVDADGNFFFMEMNTRIQVEHPVTEMITGVDLVKEQLRIAAGEPLQVRQDEIGIHGWAIEFRINAEDPAHNFYPSIGKITALEVPVGPGIRVDSALYEGYSILPFYDSLVAKLIVWGATREEAILRARRALSEYRVEGIKTTIPLHLRLLEDPDFLSGRYHTAHLEHLLASGLELQGQG